MLRPVPTDARLDGYARASRRFGPAALTCAVVGFWAAVAAAGPGGRSLELAAAALELLGFAFGIAGVGAAAVVLGAARRRQAALRGLGVSLLGLALAAALTVAAVLSGLAALEA